MQYFLWKTINRNIAYVAIPDKVDQIVHGRSEEVGCSGEVNPGGSLHRGLGNIDCHIPLNAALVILEMKENVWIGVLFIM